MRKFLFSLICSPILVLADVPNNPANLTFTNVTNSSITLNWKDNSDHESGFKIYRDGLFISLLDPNTKKFTDKNLKPDTTYTYTVKSTTDEFTKVSHYDVKCDGTDEGLKIQNALDDFKNWRGGMLLFPRDKTCIAHSLQWGYKLSGDNGKTKGYIEGSSDKHYVIFGNGSTLKAPAGADIGTQEAKSYILWIINGKYIDLISLNFDGNRATRNRKREQVVTWVDRNSDFYQYYYNANLVLSNLQHVRVENVSTKNSIEDGVYISWIDSKNYPDIGGYPADFTFKNLKATNAFRNNLTISNCIGCLVDGGEFSSARGVSPEAGIDIECDAVPSQGVCLKDITIQNTLMQDNAGAAISVAYTRKLVNGEDVYLSNKNINITSNIFKNCRLRESEGCDAHALAITASGMSSGSSITRNRFLNFKSRGGVYKSIRGKDDSMCRSLIDFGSGGSTIYGGVDVSVNYFQNIIGLKDDDKRLIYIHGDNGGGNSIHYNGFKNVGYDIKNGSDWYSDAHIGLDSASSFKENTPR